MEKNVQELEIRACRTFVCPNMRIIDEKGKVLDLRDGTIERAKKLATEYFGKTYHNPHYSSAKYLLPAFVHIASILEGDNRTQDHISNVFGTTHVTIKKWREDILDVLNIELVCSKEPILNVEMLMNEIDREGKALSLRRGTIKRAKELALEYFDKVDRNKYFRRVTQLLPAFVYIASIIENDKRNQYEISNMSGVKESIISKWKNDILINLNMKIIEHCGHIITEKKRHDDI